MFLKKFVEILLNYIQEENDRNSKVLDFYQPAEMIKKINLCIPENAMNLSDLLKVFF